MWCPNFVWYSISSGISSSHPSGSTRSTMSLDSCFLCTWSWWWWPYVSPLSAHTSSSTLRITDGEGGEIHYRKGYLQTVSMVLWNKLYVIAWTTFCYMLSTKHITGSARILRCGSPSAISAGFQQWRICINMHLVTFVNSASVLYMERPYSEHEHVQFGVVFKLLPTSCTTMVTPHSSSCVHVSLMQAMDKFLCRRLHILLCLPLFLLLLSFQNQVSYMHSTF